jgi:hypothetical protein
VEKGGIAPHPVIRATKAEARVKERLTNADHSVMAAQAAIHASLHT